MSSLLTTPREDQSSILLLLPDCRGCERACTTPSRKGNTIANKPSFIRDRRFGHFADVVPKIGYLPEESLRWPSGAVTHRRATPEDVPKPWDRITSTVSYLHRNLKDFLDTDTAQKILFNVLGLTFDLCLSFMLSYVSRVKSGCFIDHTRRVLDLSNKAIWTSIVQLVDLARLVSSEYSMLCLES